MNTITKKKLTKLQQEVLIGILLGNAKLQTFNEGITYRLRILDENKQYIEDLYNIFKDYTITPPKQIITKKGEIRWYFNTIAFPGFRFYAHQFYDKTGRNKKIPKLIHRWLSPRSLAYWFMNSSKWNQTKYNKKLISIRLSTNCSEKHELILLCEAFKRCYDIVPNLIKLQKHRINQYIIYIPVKCSLKFCNIIFPFVSKEMTFCFKRNDLLFQKK